jgi:serine protease Do
LDAKTRVSFLLLLTAVLAVLLAGCSEKRSGSKVSNNAVAAQTSQETPSPSRIPEDEPVALVAARVGPSVVQVNVEALQQTPLGRQRGEGIGSGVIYSEDGYIVTNNHVVEGASGVNVSFADGTTESAKIVGADPYSEIAVLRVDRGDLPAADFNKEDLLVGQLAVAIGSPSGFESTVTSGIVSAVGREFPPELTGSDEEARRSLVDLVQTDAAISPGNSGGALANRDGEIIGINVAYLPPSETGAVNLGFAIPSDSATSIADQLIETGEVSTPYLGVITRDLSQKDAERFGLPMGSGALVDRVEPGSGAAEAGMRPDDVITALGDSEIEDYGDLLGTLRNYRPGDTARLTVFRDGTERTLEVTLGERPE